MFLVIHNKDGIVALLLTILCGVVFFSCQFPYTPVQELPLESEKDTLSSSDVKVFLVNGGKQTCNASISLDTLNFSGCMLWLNFSGSLVQKLPAEIADFSLTAEQHDRLTITDTSNTVRWFMMREELGASTEEHIQDPEWSADPEYIVCLLSSQRLTKWSCMAVHPLTRNKFKICNEKMIEEATPHLWVSDSGVHAGIAVDPPVYDSTGFAGQESVESFFGTSNVKVVYSYRRGGVLSLSYTDYESGEFSVRLARPEGKESWHLESPLISPDGKWVVYNAFQNTRYYESYIQELTPESKPILLAQGASDPHWWIHPDDKSLQFVIYTLIPGDNLVLDDLSASDLLRTGEAGITYRQQVKLFHGRPSISSVMKIGEPEVLISLPMKGGVSPDGRFICTGYNNAYIVRFY